MHGFRGIGPALRAFNRGPRRLRIIVIVLETLA